MASIAEDPSPKRICACFGEVITGDAFGNGRSHPSRIHPRGRHHNSFALASAGDHRRSVCSKLFVAGVVLFLRFMRDARQSSRRSNDDEDDDDDASAWSYVVDEDGDEDDDDDHDEDDDEVYV